MGGLIVFSDSILNGFTLNLMAGLVAYCLKENKLSLNLTDVELNSMVVA